MKIEGFKEVYDIRWETYKKEYEMFTLYVNRHINSPEGLFTATVHDIDDSAHEIYLKDNVDENWIREFDKLMQ